MFGAAHALTPSWTMRATISPRTRFWRLSSLAVPVAVIMTMVAAAATPLIREQVPTSFRIPAAEVGAVGPITGLAVVRMDAPMGGRTIPAFAPPLARTSCRRITKGTLSRAGMSPRKLARRMGTTSSAVMMEITSLCAAGIEPPQVAAQVMKDAAFTVIEIGKFLDTSFEQTPRQVDSALYNVGFGIEDIMAVAFLVMAEAAKAAAEDLKAILTQVKELDLVQGLMRGLKNVYALQAQDATQILKDIGEPIDPIAESLNTEFDLGEQAVSDVLTAVGFESNAIIQALLSVFAADWPQFRSDPTRSGYNAIEFVLSPSTVGGMVEDGRGSIAGSSSPAVVNDAVYVGSKDDGKVYALALGQFSCPQLPCPPRLGVVWSFATGGLVESSPAVANGVVYVGSDDGSVYALSAATGAVLWSYATGGIVSSSPAVSNGVVYVGSDDGAIYALDANRGGVLWSYATEGSVSSSPAVANGIVYVGSNNGSVYALDAATGEALWSYATGGSVSSSPAVANGVVYVGSDNGTIYALDANRGEVLWSYATEGSVSSSPAVANGIVYVGSDDGSVYALSAATGEVLWSYATGTHVGSSAAVSNGMVYVGSSDTIYVFGTGA